MGEMGRVVSSCSSQRFELLRPLVLLLGDVLGGQHVLHAEVHSGDHGVWERPHVPQGTELPRSLQGRGDVQHGLLCRLRLREVEQDLVLLGREGGLRQGPPRRGPGDLGGRSQRRAAHRSAELRHEEPGGELVNSFQTQGAPPGKPSPTRSSLGRTPRKWEIVKNAGSREAVGLFDGLESFIRGKQAIAADEQGQAVAESNNDGYRMKMEVKFTLPRPRDERGYRNEVEEEIIGDGPGSPRSMHSKGRMFGLTFWENYYVVAEGNPDGSFITGNGKFSNPVAPAPVPASPKRSGELTLVSSVAEESAEALKAAGVLRGRLQEAAHSVKSPFWSSKPPLPALPATIQTQTTLTGTPVVDPDQGVAWKFIYYTGHTLQGNYKGAFVYSREPILPAKYEPAIEAAAKQVGLDITQFCRIRNTCFLSEDAPYANPGSQKLQAQAKQKRGWFPIFEMTRSVAQELSDWFGDPTLVSDWLLAQQERVVLQQPLETSPFADLVQK
eukprot:scaffold825_cov249-Pinguiococcus_pyrenoidosus.AAC.71